MFVISISSSELKSLRKHEVRNGLENIYNPYIASLMYESTTRALDRLDSDIAYISMESAVILCTENSRPIFDKWSNDRIISYVSSIFSGLFNKHSEISPLFGDSGLFVFDSHIKNPDNYKIVLNQIENSVSSTYKRFAKRLIAGNLSGEKKYDKILDQNSTKDIVAKYPHICWQGITILNKGYQKGFESLIDRNPKQCFQEYFNQNMNGINKWEI